MRVTSVAATSGIALVAWTSFASLGLLALPAAVAAGPATLVRDIETQFDPALAPPAAQRLDDAPFARVGGVTYFFAADDLHGRELWSSEGTDSSTRMVIDLCPGVCSSWGLGLVAAGSSVYFWADDGASGTELWRSDGTAEGTRRAPEFCSGPCRATNDTLPRLHPVGEKVFLELIVNGARELWGSDGTETGTRRVVTWPIVPTIPGDADKIQGTLGGWVLFEFPSTAAGTELWRSDGTEEGTGLFADLCPGPTSSLAFVVGTTDTRALVQTTGCTSFIAHSLVDNFGQVTEFGNPSTFRMQFGVQWDANALLVVAGPELVLLDLVARSGVVLANVAPQILGGQAVGVPVVSGGRAFFPALSAGFGVEPWITDGTIGGTRRLLDLMPGDGSSMSQLEPPTAAGSGDGGFFFEASTGAGREPWFTDGTAAGTRNLGDIAPGPVDSRPRFGGGSPSMMIASERVNGGSLFVTDGTAAGTRLTTSPRHHLASSSPHDLTGLVNRIAFGATTLANGDEPWHSDGTAEGTRLIADTASRPGSGIHNFIRFGARWVFTSNGKLQVMNRAGTKVTPIAGAELAEQFVTLNGLLFFSAAPSFANPQVFGAPEPFVLAPLKGHPTASMLADIFPGADCQFLFCFENGSYPSDPVSAGGGTLVYFAANDGVSGREPWISDRTTAGTRRVADLCPGETRGRPRFSAPRDLIGFPDGSALAIVDGDCAPRLVRLRPDAPPVVLFESNAPIREIALLGRRVYYFFRQNGGDELRFYDLDDLGLSGQGTVRRLWVGGRPGFASGLVVSGSRLYFRVTSDPSGEELWSSDGTRAGTRMLEIAPGRRGSGPRNLTSIDGQLVFSATDGVAGAELWISDGTKRGTRLIQDLAPGPDASSPSDFVVFKDHVFFAAGDATHGRELWWMPRNALR